MNTPANSTISTALPLTQVGLKHYSADCTDALVFKQITSDDMPLIQEYLNREEGRTTDFSFGGVLMWVDLFKYEFAVYNDTLFIKGRLENDLNVPAYSMPVGSLSLAESVDILRQHSRDNGLPLMFSAIPEYALSQFMSLGPKHITLLEGWGDYLYDADKLATLSGKKMAKKRNHVNQYVALYGNDTFEPITAANIEDVRSFMDSLESATPETELSPMAVAERRLAAKALSMMGDENIPYEGGLLRVNGKVAAFTVGDVKGDTLFIHIEKADRGIPGSYEAINKFFAAYMKERHTQIKYINREDDAGDEGLRKAKESYHPLEVLKKYNVVF